MSRVALFDLDGTLTRTNDIDGSCFLAAVHAELGVLAEADWSRYRHCTDEGIATELWLRHVGAPPAAADLARLRRRFLALLRRAARAEPHRFDAVDVVAHRPTGGPRENRTAPVASVHHTENTWPM